MRDTVIFRQDHYKYVKFGAIGAHSVDVRCCLVNDGWKQIDQKDALRLYSPSATSDDALVCEDDVQMGG